MSAYSVINRKKVRSTYRKSFGCGPVSSEMRPYFFFHLFDFISTLYTLNMRMSGFEECCCSWPSRFLTNLGGWRPIFLLAAGWDGQGEALSF